MGATPNGGAQGVEVVLFVFGAMLIGVFSRVIVRNFHLVDVPYTVTLFVIGVLWGAFAREGAGSGPLATAAGDSSAISADLFLFTFLPVLIFASAFDCKWHMFTSELTQIVVLSVFGVVISAGLTAVAVVYLLESSWTWSEAWLLGAILSATDPVAVVALMRESGAPIQIITVMEGESLLNDGFSMVLYEVFVVLAAGGSAEAGSITRSFVQLSVGGVLIGVVFGGVTVAVLGRIQHDSIIELALVFAGAYLLYYLADFKADVSGVLAVVSYGLVFPWFGTTRFSPGTAHHVESFLGMMAWVSETIIFVLSGVIIANRVRVNAFSASDFGKCVLLWLFEIIIRGLMFLILSPILVRTGHGFDFKRAVTFTWGGLRGAVSVALALSTELHPDIDLMVRDKILLYTAGMMVMTLLVNAPLTSPLLRWIVQMDRSQDGEGRHQFRLGIEQLAARTKAHIEALGASPQCGLPPHWDTVEELVTSFSSKVTDKFPTAGVHVDQGEDYDIEVQGLDRSDYNALRHARLLFLRAVSHNLEHQSQAGALRWNSAKFLGHMVEALEDTVSHSQEKWFDEGHHGAVDRHNRRLTLGGTEGSARLNIVRMMRHPAWVEYAREYCLFTGMVDRFAASELEDTVNTLDGLVHAYHYAMKFVDGKVGQYVQASVQAEGQEVINSAEAELLRICRLYPIPFRQVRSVAAAQRVLAHQLTDIQEHSSNFSPRELILLEEEIREKQNRLVLNREYFREALSQGWAEVDDPAPSPQQLPRGTQVYNASYDASGSGDDGGKSSGDNPLNEPLLTS